MEMEAGLSVVHLLAKATPSTDREAVINAVKAAEERFARHPERILSEAVRRMLPKSRLGRKMLTKLKIYQGPEHPHQAQRPEPREMGQRKSGR